MGKTKALTDGPIPVSYIEVIAAIRDFSENSMDSGSDRAATTAAELQTLVATHFPEYASKIVDWRTIASLVNRVPVDAWALIEDFALKHQMMSPPIPQTWLRDPSLGCVASESIPIPDFFPSSDQHSISIKWKVISSENTK